MEAGGGRAATRGVRGGGHSIDDCIPEYIQHTLWRGSGHSCVHGWYRYQTRLFAYIAIDAPQFKKEEPPWNGSARYAPPTPEVAHSWLDHPGGDCGRSLLVY